AVAAGNAEGRAVEVQHRAAHHLVAAPNLTDGSRAANAVFLREERAHHLAELRRAGVFADALDVLQKTVPLDRRGIGRLRAAIYLAVVLGGDDDRIVQLRDAVLARHLPQRPCNIE